MPTFSLKALLTALFAVLFLLFGSIEMYWNTRAATQELEEKVGQSLQQLAYEMTDKLDRGMFERARDVEILSELEGFKNGTDSRDQKRALLDKMKSTFPSYAWIGLTDVQGQVQVSTGGLLEGQNVSTRPWFQGALKGPFAGDVHEAKLLAKLLPQEGNEPLRFVDVATPIYDSKGRIAGVLGAHLSWSWAKEVRESLLQPVQEREHLDVFILDRAGTILLGPPALQGQVLRLNALERFPVSGYSVERWADGRTYVTGLSRSRGYRTYNGLEWRVVVRQDTDIAFAGVSAFQKITLFANGVLSILFALIGLVLAHMIARPLTRLRSAAQAIEAGVLSAEVPQVRAYLEANTLSHALQQLVGNLKRNERELEQRILERTEDLQSRTKEAEALSALSILSTENRHPRELAEALAPIIAEASDLDWVGLTTVNEAHALKATLYTRAGLRPLPDITLTENVEQGLHHAALVQNRALYIEDYPTQVQALPQYVQSGVHSSAFLPLPSQGGERYVLFAARRERRPWVETDRRVLEAAARSVQISQERQAYLHDLEFAALHDRLTGLGNRRAFDQNLDQAVSAAKRHQGTFGIMIIDLDGLKAINDLEGHERGDGLLREFAAALRAAFRNEDRIFRLGGDEYAILLDRAVTPGGHAVLERVRAAVRLTRQAGYVNMDASAGIAFFPEDASDGPELTRLADERMYEEKRDHRALRLDLRSGG